MMKITNRILKKNRFVPFFLILHQFKINFLTIIQITVTLFKNLKIGMISPEMIFLF